MATSDVEKIVTAAKHLKTRKELRDVLVNVAHELAERADNGGE